MPWRSPTTIRGLSMPDGQRAPPLSTAPAAPLSRRCRPGSRPVRRLRPRATLQMTHSHATTDSLSQRGRWWHHLGDLRPCQRTPPGRWSCARWDAPRQHPDRTPSAQPRRRRRQRAPRDGLATDAHPRSLAPRPDLLERWGQDHDAGCPDVISAGAPREAGLPAGSTRWRAIVTPHTCRSKVYQLTVGALKAGRNVRGADQLPSCIRHAVSQPRFMTTKAPPPCET